MAAFSKFNVFPTDLATKGHDFSADVFKVMLTNTAPAATNVVRADVTKIAAGGGYVAGGLTTALTLASAAGVLTVKAANVSLTATGAVAAFRYAVVYNATSEKLVAYYDYGSSSSLVQNDQFTVAFDQTAGLLQIA